MTARVIPLTPNDLPLWSQREYVACRELGIEFAAHRAGEIHQWFHYAFPNGIGCTSILVGPNSGAIKYVDHNFSKECDWLEQCSAAVRGVV